MNIINKSVTYIFSAVGAAGTGLQNTMAVYALLQSTKLSRHLIHVLAIGLGGGCSAAVNLFINVKLLEDFSERLFTKPVPTLYGWQRVRYWAGSIVFITTGMLFGLTALAFGPMGPLAFLSVTSGLFVALMMMIQELETWLASFDEQNQLNKKNETTVSELFNHWKTTLSKEKAVGHLIAIGNVIALSLLFTLGLASFLIQAGVASFPALLIASTVSFTGGAFTEFYFYNYFIATFCHQFKENWQAFLESNHSMAGLIIASSNAVVNGMLSYVGIMMLPEMLISAGLACPPMSVMMAVSLISSFFAAAASFMLGIDFWTVKNKPYAMTINQTSLTRNASVHQRFECQSSHTNLETPKKMQTQASQIKRSSFFSGEHAKHAHIKHSEASTNLNDSYLPMHQIAR